jgi:hypothetical protein
MISNDDIQAGIIAYMKSKPAIVSLLSKAGDIKESQWMGTDFTYPAIRVYVDFSPTIPPCSPDDANIGIEVYSEQKSSAEAQNIAGVIHGIFHGHPFQSTGATIVNGIGNVIKFPMVYTKQIKRAERSIYAWMACVDLHVLVKG